MKGSEIERGRLIAREKIGEIAPEKRPLKALQLCGEGIAFQIFSLQSAERRPLIVGRSTREYGANPQESPEPALQTC
jgi:hypothetical protein